MNERERLTRVFERINDAYIEAAKGRYGDENLASFVDKLRSGTFFELPEERQIGGLDWYDQAYLGRGECLWGMIDKGLLPKGFADEMRIAFMMYYLTMHSISETRKVGIRKQLAELMRGEM